MSEASGKPRSWRESWLRAIALVLALVTLATVIIAGVNFTQRARYVRPYDGIDWDECPSSGFIAIGTGTYPCPVDNIFAASVAQDTPGDWAGVRISDVLLEVNGHPVRQPIDVNRHLFRAQPGTQLQYKLQRVGRSEAFTATVVAIPRPDPFSLRGFLEFVGVLYLAIGLFVLLKRWNASHAVHFYLICLTSFIFYSFSYSGKFNTFDWTVYWSDTVARLLLPALFLHFALAFPEPKPWFARRRWLFGLVYIPAAVLLGIHIVTVGAPLLPQSVELFSTFDRIELIHLAVLFLLAAGVFEYTYRRSTSPLLTQQMKLVTRGTWLAILPFASFYVLPIFLDPEYVPNDWMKLSALTLVFIPLTFGYAVIRYRLMDVDIIFRRGVAFTLATAAIAAIYFGVAIGVAELFQTRGGMGSGGVILALIIAAILFQPIKDWTQLQLERLFYRERFDLRRTLEAFGRELSGEIHLDPLQEKLLDRLARTLPAERVAILLADDARRAGQDSGLVPEIFRLTRAEGIGRQRLGTCIGLKTLPEVRHLYIEGGSVAGLLPPDDLRQLEELGLSYLIPCRIQDRTIALLAIGRTADGRLLTSEDLELLETLADYIAVALENARLYLRLEQEAEQVARLKDFSENILESTSVGLVALDPAGEIESWNSSMERATGRPRFEALGRRLEEVFPRELVKALEARREEARPSSIYRFYLTRADGQRRVTNIALAPLVSKQGQPIGRLLIFDDISERVQLEDQLLQAEKLSSIGLLAAGVAHEVNTPLAVISNYAQMLAKQTPAGDQRAALVEKIVKQTFRASEIISNLLNFSRTGPAAFSRVDLNRTLADAVALAEPHLSSSRISIETALEDALPAIHGDPGKLQQVFLNLIFNARDAMPHGGRLRVRTLRQNALVQVEVADSGVGIPAENLDKIYDPFFTTKATGRGTGLGLAVTYGIVQEHNGSIQLSSRVGEGTTFLLEFPVLVERTAKPWVTAEQSVKEVS